MDGQRFDELTRKLGLSLNRKRFFAAIGALPMAVGTPRNSSGRVKALTAQTSPACVRATPR